MRNIARDVAELRSKLRSGQHEGVVARYITIAEETVAAIEEVADAVNAVSRLEDALRAEEPDVTPEEAAAMLAQDERILAALKRFAK